LVNLQQEQEIWILLTRHLVSTQRTCDFISLRAEFENPALPPLHLRHQVTHTGSYTNSVHCLIQTRIPSSFRSGILAITALYQAPAQGLPQAIGFTVSVFHASPIQATWEKTPLFSSSSRVIKLQGTFTHKNSGGNPTYPSFRVNPQYHLHIPPSTHKSNMKLVLVAPKEVPVNIVVLWSKGDRKHE